MKLIYPTVWNVFVFATNIYAVSLGSNMARKKNLVHSLPKGTLTFRIIFDLTPEEKKLST